jgi:hypothetical protein
LPRYEPDYAKGNDNPRSSIHKFTRTGYSALAPILDTECSILHSFRSGTGSYPHPPQGWHRARRFNPSQLPWRIPCTSTASKKYAEQVGVNRQPELGPQSIRSNCESVH